MVREIIVLTPVYVSLFWSLVFFNQQIFGKQSTLLAGGFYGGGGCFV